MSLPVCLHVEHLGHLRDSNVVIYLFFFNEEILFVSHEGEHTKLQLVLLASLRYISDSVYMYICKKIFEMYIFHFWLEAVDFVCKPRC